MKLEDVLDVLKALEREGVRYAVFGGVAMAAHGLDRGTRDLDVFLSADPENVLRLRSALHSVYDDPAIQYGPPDVNFTLDLVTRLGEAFTFSDLGDVEIAVVTPRTLYAMKHDTVRPRDADDAARLRRAFDVEA